MSQDKLFNQDTQPLPFSKAKALNTPDILYNKILSPLGLTVMGATAYGLHKQMIGRNTGYTQGLYKAVTTIEEKSPFSLARLFGASDRLASYITPSTLSYTSNDLFTEGGNLTDLGKHFDRLFEGKHKLEFGKDISFSRIPGSNSPYLRFDQHPGLHVRFTDASGSLAGTSFRAGGPLEATPRTFKNYGNIKDNLWENFKTLKHSQTPGWHPTANILKRQGRLDVGKEFLPFHAKYVDEAATGFGKFTAAARSAAEVTHLNILNVTERAQRLILTEYGLGIRTGTWNKLAHIPFIGSGGLLNKIVTKRVLPIIGAVTAARYLDYKTNHVVSNAAIDLPLKTNVFRAELTDRIPGARAITDAYAETVPGPQYGPVAVPLGGLFAGGLYHYSKVLRGKYATKEAREAGSKILPKLAELKGLTSLSSLKGVWKNLGAPGKGLAIGLALITPFLPGMIGSRRTAAELRREYSGEDPVAVRAGRWWTIGSTPFKGSRIISWRPHASVLIKNRIATKSLYGSEENYWAHNPILHPFKYLKDPYYLEKLHYEDRPYPISSPAFSNIPLVGPLLAATIGKLVKPPKRMHEDQWSNDSSYVLFNKKLEPRGPVVESKFERMALVELAKKGFKAETQHPVTVDGKNYRLDFVVGDEKNRLAIETDGITYHHTKREKRNDAVRQAALEKAGWKIARVQSTAFFEDPQKALAPVFKQLDKMGIKPIKDYQTRDIASGLVGLAPSKATGEFGLKDTTKREATIFSELVGLPGYIARTLWNKVTAPKDNKLPVYLQGSREMESWSRRYYEKELGEGVGPNPSGELSPYGHTEPLRRFIQPEGRILKANEIPNKMPSWLPGSEYGIDFHKGDPYVGKVAEGYARLPGAGYEALHPELEGLNPEDYPDITKYEILSDVAPYSANFARFKKKLAADSEHDLDLKIRYEQATQRADETKASIATTANRIFTGKAENITGTVKYASSEGVVLDEYPGQRFRFSSLGMSAADLSAVALGENNNLTRTQLVEKVRDKQASLNSYLSDQLASGTRVNLMIPFGASESSEDARAVIAKDGTVINTDLIDLGLAKFDKSNSGEEAQGLYGVTKNILGGYAEELAFAGEDNQFSILRALPTPYHSKLWQEKTPLAQYIDQEVVGTRMRRWDRPIHDFLRPYARKTVERVTGIKVIPEEVQFKRDMNTLVDELNYIRGLKGYTNQERRTSIGGNLFASPDFDRSTVPGRDKRYFNLFLSETDPKKRDSILQVVSPELAKALTAQWTASEARIKRSKGENVGAIDDDGVLETEAGLKEYRHAKTKLGYGDYMRTKEVAQFFNRTGFALPDMDSETAWSGNLDYEDVKLKIIENEGYDYHDFDIFDDRANMLWRKPYIEGAVNELTSGNTRSPEVMRQTIENLIIKSRENKNAKVALTSNTTHRDRTNIRIDVDDDQLDKTLKDIRRNPHQYKDQ